MEQTASHLEEVVAQLRPILPAASATAQAIDRHEPMEQIVQRAIDDGYVCCADDFVPFVEACVRSST